MEGVCGSRGGSGEGTGDSGEGHGGGDLGRDMGWERGGHGGGDLGHRGGQFWPDTGSGSSIQAGLVPHGQPDSRASPCLARGRRREQGCPGVRGPQGSDTPPLRFYLVGGGAPLVICGVTAATNIRNYGMEAEDAA